MIYYQIIVITLMLSSSLSKLYNPSTSFKTSESYRQPIYPNSDFIKLQLGVRSRQIPYRNKVHYDDNKENCDFIQFQQLKYSPMKSYSFQNVSPMKKSSAQSELGKSRRNKLGRKEVQETQNISISPILEIKPERRSNQLQQATSNRNLRSTSFSGNDLGDNAYYQVNSRLTEQKDMPITSRISSRIRLTQNLYDNLNKTPPKYNLNENKLIEKSEFLKQKIYKISRMTPKGSKIKIQLNNSNTPDKEIAKQVPFSIQQQYDNHNPKFNKFCLSKLPLQPIFDIQELRQSTLNESEPDAETGLQQIHRLSQKISDRLNSIICRHAN